MPNKAGDAGAKVVEEKKIPDGVKIPEMADWSTVEYKTLAKNLMIASDEMITHYYYSESNNVTAITSARVIKFEGGKIQSDVRLSDIQIATYVDNGIFKWHKLRVYLKNGKEETYGIKRPDVIKYFVEVIHELTAE
jgi:hypothetical protein